MARGFTESHHASVEAELAAERGDALARTGRKVESAHRRCLAAAEAARGAEGPVARRDALRSYRQARHELEHAVWQLCVQREALGLTDHRWVRHTWPTPPVG